MLEFLLKISMRAHQYVDGTEHHKYNKINDLEATFKSYYKFRMTAQRRNGLLSNFSVKLCSERPKFTRRFEHRLYIDVIW